MRRSDRPLFGGLVALILLLTASPSGVADDKPGFKDKLSDADIWAVLSFIESTWPADIRERQQRTTRQAR